MKRVLLLSLFVLLATIGVQAQIPSEVKEVMTKCQKAMNNPNGLEYTMNMKLSMGPISLTNSKLTIASKGEMNRTLMTMSVAGIEATFESGYDGKESWEVKHSEKQDTIRITKGRKNESDDALDFDMAKGFKKAKMKLKDGYYEIEYYDPIDKKSEMKKIIFVVSAKNFYLHELRTSAKGAKVTMTITKIRVGLRDDYFKINPSKYPNAVVVRE